MTVDDGNFVLHGVILYMKSEEELFETADGYLVCMEGVSAGVFEELPEEFSDWPLIDCPEELIIPGLVDTRADSAPTSPTRRSRRPTRSRRQKGSPPTANMKRGRLTPSSRRSMSGRRPGQS